MSLTRAVVHEDLVYDVGMHKGEDTDFYLRKGFRVIGFEADPDLIQHCKNRFLEALERGRLVIVEGAIAEHRSGESAGQTARFYKNLEMSFLGTINAGWADRNETLGTHSSVVEVKTVDFAEQIRGHGIPHYMKIDIEGSDTVCLKSLLGFELKPSYISIESDKRSFKALRGEMELMARLGYDNFKVVQQRTIHHQNEPSPSGEGLYVGQAFQHGSSGLFGKDLPGRWRTRGQILKEYRIIFILYRLFGDYSLLRKFILARMFRRAVEIVIRRPIPGWYDTHARHSSVSPEGHLDPT